MLGQCTYFWVNQILLSMKNTLLILLFMLCALQISYSQEPVNKRTAKGEFSVLNQHLKEYINNNQLPGLSALVLQKGKVVFQTHMGHANLEKGIKINEHTRFRLASLTKPITSVATLQLVDKGLLDLNAPVSRYLPEFSQLKVHGSEEEMGDKLLVRHLMSHSSGISSAFYTDEVGQMYANDFKDDYESLADLVASLAEMPLAAVPGTAFFYGYSTDVLGYLIEKITQQPLEEYLQGSLLGPLEMHHSGYSVAANEMETLATLYHTGEEGALLPHTVPESYNAIARGNTGLVTTIADYSNFCQMLLNEGQYKGKKILSKKLVKLLHQNELPPEALPMEIGPFTFDGMGFGLGVGIFYGTQSTG